MRISSWTGPRRPNGGVALAALLSAAFVITAGFGGPMKDGPSTSTASAETCSLQAVTPSTVVVGLGEAHPRFDVAFSGCAATWSISWPTAGATAGREIPAGTVDPARLTASDAGRSNLYVTLRADDHTSNRTPVPVSLKRRATWGAVSADPGPDDDTLTLRSVLGRADWDAGAYRGYPDRPVAVMFRSEGQRAFSTYATARTGPRGRLRVDVPAGRSGDWRLEYAGNQVTSAAISAGRHV